jgi:hypothetical protein
MQPTDVRRHPDNSIDCGFYRRRAARLRSATMRKSVRGMASMIRPLVAIALLVGTVLAVPTRAPQVPDRATDVAATEAGDRLTAN